MSQTSPAGARRFPARKRRTRQHIVADLSVNYIERAILRCGWAAERVVSDYGTDLLLFTFSPDGELENGWVQLQLKATDNLSVLADEETIAFSLETADLAHWLNEVYPVILIVYNAQADVAYWLYVQAYFADRGKSEWMDSQSVTVHIPMTNQIDEAAIRRFAQFRDSVYQQTQGVIHHDV